MSDLGDKNLKEWNSRYNITFNSSPEVFAQTGIFFHFKVQAIAVKIKVKTLWRNLTVSVQKNSLMRTVT